MKTHRIIKFINTFFAHFISSSLRLISKIDDDWKRIHDFSYLKIIAKRTIISINVYIFENEDTFEYVTFDEIVQTFIRQSREIILMKRDLTKTFRHISMIEIDWWLLNFFWENDYYYDRFLSFDLRIFFYIFDFLIKILHWIVLIVFHWVIILHYLDDFFAILLSRVDSILYQKYIDDLCIKFEFKINHKKNICNIIVDFLDIEFDNEFIKTRLLKKKFERAIQKIKSILNQSFLSYIELQSLVDFLSFVVKMIISNKVFFRRLYDAFRIKVYRHHIIAIIKLDL